MKYSCLKKNNLKIKYSSKNVSHFRCYILKITGWQGKGLVIRKFHSEHTTPTALGLKATIITHFTGLNRLLSGLVIHGLSLRLKTEILFFNLSPSFINIKLNKTKNHLPVLHNC